MVRAGDGLAPGRKQVDSGCILRVERKTSQGRVYGVREVEGPRMPSRARWSHLTFSEAAVPSEGGPVPVIYGHGDLFGCCDGGRGQGEGEL